MNSCPHISITSNYEFDCRCAHCGKTTKEIGKDLEIIKLKKELVKLRLELITALNRDDYDSEREALQISQKG